MKMTITEITSADFDEADRHWVAQMTRSLPQLARALYLLAQEQDRTIPADVIQVYLPEMLKMWGKPRDRFEGT